MARDVAVLAGRPRPVRIALVCPYAWDRAGGVQSHVRSLAVALRRRGHDVTVIAPATAAIFEEHVVVAGRAVGVPANGSVAPISFGPRAARSVRDAVDRIDPDVLHLHEPLIPSLSFLSLRKATRPAVGTFHAAAEGSLGYRLGRPLLAPAARRLDARAAVSEPARALVARYFPGDYVITPNGIDYERFASAVGVAVERPRVLFFGRLEKRKGARTLIEAMSFLRDLDVELIIAGSGPEERSLKELAGARGVTARFLGRIPDAEVAGLYASATVYCAPATGGESFGIVLLEAMASGAAVACSDLPGFRAVAGEAAAFFPADDHRALASLLRELLRDDAARERMVRGGRARARDFDWAQLVPGVEELYERAIMRK